MSEKLAYALAVFVHSTSSCVPRPIPRVLHTRPPQLCMRIAILHYTCPPVAGGVERVMMDHARLFAAHGHAVTIVCGEGEGTGEPGIEVRVLPELRRPEGEQLSCATVA